MIGIGIGGMVQNQTADGLSVQKTAGYPMYVAVDSTFNCYQMSHGWMCNRKSEWIEERMLRTIK